MLQTIYPKKEQKQSKKNQKKMNSKIIILNVLLLSCFTITTLTAQEKVTKVSQSINVDKNVTIDLNTSYCNIVFDTWNKNEVQIEAFVESDELSKDELEQIAKSWQLDIDGSTNLVAINTRSSHSPNVWIADNAHYNDEVKRVLKELKYELAEMPEMNFDFSTIDIPEPPEPPKVPKFPKMPELPELPELPEGVGAVAFDYEAYKKDGDAYLEKWSKKFESTYGKEYAKKMEAWGEQFGTAWEEKFGEDYAKKMEAWGERYAALMERKAERIAEQQERNAELAKKQAKQNKTRAIFINRWSDKTNHSQLKKTIIIKMPKKAKIKVDVRHGELEFASVLDDVQAHLSHTSFKAQGINGSNTSISAAYAPVFISNWNLGELNLKHVKQAELETVKHVVLNCTSSNVKINNVLNSAIVDSNIGDLKILNVADSFTNLNFIFQNNKAYIVMPEENYNMNYKGIHSYLVHPNNTSGKTDASSFSMSNTESNKTVTVNAKYSKVIIE
jgi:hypothetical protein